MRYLLLFILLTLVLTYPLLLHMHEAVQEAGDSLFNTWIISWDIKALLRNPFKIFHTNIFYPHKYTLAYSEHLIGLALLALPVYLFTKNPLFIYNFMLILSFVLCGWGAYLLTYHLTKDRISGIVAGIIFSFCPYRFDQFGHIHILTSQWIPFALLFLHKRSWALFGFFFFLQFISSGHNGLYLALAVVLFILYFRVFPWKVLLVVGILIVPFYYPYVYLAREFGFERPLYEFKLYSPQLSSYLGVLSENWLYGRFLSRFCRPEAVMFPGAIALLLVFWKKIPRFRVKWSIVNILILIDLLFILLIAITGGIDLGKSIFDVKLKVTDFTRPVFILLILLASKIRTKKIHPPTFLWSIGLRGKDLKTPLTSTVGLQGLQEGGGIHIKRGPVQFYWLLGITAFILSFGPTIRAMDKDVMWGPYSLLYNFVPGFKGLRVSGRIYTLFILSIAVLAGFGVKKLKRRWFIPFIILAEYITLPISLNCWIGTKPPAVYDWLAKQPGDSVMVELPMPDYYSNFSKEIPYVYWSLFHNKKLINGYSGYSPPSYWPIAERMWNFPDEDTIEILRCLGVKYVVQHGWETDKFPLRFRDGDNYVYELDMFDARRRTTDGRGPTSTIVAISTNCNTEDVHYVIDNDPSTRWHSGRQQEPGMFVEVDLGEIRKVCSVSMYFGEAVMDYPRGIELELDGKKVPLKLIYANYVKHLIEYPKDNRMIINFEPREARYIKITQTGRHDAFFWSIYELQVYTVG